MALEAPADRIRQVYLSASFYEQYKIPEKLAEVPVEIVEDRVFAQMSDTKTPQGILCLVKQYHYDREEILGKTKPLLLVLEDLQDPGNVGTIFRTAEGAGADGIILASGCVDIYHPKTIRSTMGSVYRVPFFYEDDLTKTIQELRKCGIRTYAADLSGKNSYDQEDYQSGTAFLIGNEEGTQPGADPRGRLPDTDPHGGKAGIFECGGCGGAAFVRRSQTADGIAVKGSRKEERG